MKIKRPLMLAVLPTMHPAANAQSYSKGNTPKKGDLAVAATVRYNSYTNVTAPSGLLTDYEVRALSTNWADRKLMAGSGGDWFSKDQRKLNLDGGVSFTNDSGYPAVSGIIDDSNMNNSVDENMGEIPNYRAVASAQLFAYSVSVSINRYFSIKRVPNLMWYTGVRVGFVYGENEMKHGEETSMGKSVAENRSLRGALTIGVDYYALPVLYAGAQIDPFAYTYNKTTYNPQAGPGDLPADSHNYSVLAALMFKIGSKFRPLSPSGR